MCILRNIHPCRGPFYDCCTCLLINSSILSPSEHEAIMLPEGEQQQPSHVQVVHGHEKCFGSNQRLHITFDERILAAMRIFACSPSLYSCTLTPTLGLEQLLPEAAQHHRFALTTNFAHLPTSCLHTFYTPL